MNLAVINWDTRKVVNVIEYTEDVAFQLHFPDNFTSRDCTNYPVCIGDDFDELTETFTRDGAPIEREMSEAERIEQLEAVIAALVGGAD